FVPVSQRLLVSGEYRQPHVAIDVRGAMAGEVLADRGDPRLAEPFDEGAAVPPDQRRIGAERAYPDDRLERCARDGQRWPEGAVAARDGDEAPVCGGHPPRRALVVEDP